VPFDFLKRKKVDGAGKAPAAGQPAPGHPRSGRGVPFDGLTEEWRIVGNMEVSGRLSDALNKRESITISDVQWAPVNGSEPLAPAPGLKAVDPYDLIIVLASETSLPPLNDEERTAHRVHKVSYDVALEVPPFRVVGTVFLHPGSEPRAGTRVMRRDLPTTRCRRHGADDTAMHILGRQGAVRS